MQLPAPRGAVTESLAAALATGRPPATTPPTPADPTDVVGDDDVQLALWMLHQLHYDGFDGVDARREWDPDLLRLRGHLEDLLLADLRDRTAGLVASAEGPVESLPERLFALVDGFDGPAVASYLQREGTAAQFAEFLAHRSVYNLRETDPQMFAMPRLPGRAQVAMAELAYDEYGGGRPERLHSLLFAEAMAGCGLSTRPGAYADVLPGATLAVVNVMHLFSLRRELVAASVGHFGTFEATSSAPSRQLAAGADRLGLPAAVGDYFDEHIEADAVHEQLAFRDICTAVVADDPAAEALVLLGAASCLVVEAAAGEHLLASWGAGRSSLLAPGSTRGSGSDPRTDVAPGSGRAAS
jgi:hypothetical protein